MDLGRFHGDELAKFGSLLKLKIEYLPKGWVALKLPLDLPK
jgi:hypothetical protein